MPRASIILPAYNAAATIERAILSCLDQTEQDFELILIDDGSTDGTGAIMSRALYDERVTLLQHSQNLGVVRALQTGVADLRSDVIVRADADDWSTPDRLEKQLTALERNLDWDGVSSLVKLEQPLGDGMQRYVDWVNSLNSPDAVASGRFIESPLIQPSMAVRRAAFEAAGGYRAPGWGEDYDLWLRMLERGCRFGKVPEVLVHWLDRPDCLTRSHQDYSPASFLRAKAHYLARLARETGVSCLIGGAGPRGKSLINHLQVEGVGVAALFDVHPRRMGETIAGLEVLPPDELSAFSPDSHFLLGTAGTPGAREALRAWFTRHDFIEGSTAFLLC